MSNIKEKTMAAPTSLWQKWAKRRAQNPSSLKLVHEITKKVKINVTQLLLDERRGE